MPKDPRWLILDLVRRCRAQLTLRDRDVAVLRGLLSLLPEGSRGGTVFAGNRVLIERCDGIEERTLRRRLAHLVSCGLIARRQSPNGKRYQLRDAGEAVLTYGFDLGPLFALEPHLTALARAAEAEALRVKALRGLIRDWLYHHGQIDVAAHDLARLALRRKLSSAELEAMLTDLQAETPALSASDSQIVRHIQSSEKEDLDSETAMTDLSLSDCLDLARTARELSPAPLRSWGDLADLSRLLAPAIGVGRAVLDRAQEALGRKGCALAVLGLLEAFGRIRNPEAYLATLIRKAPGLDMVRMFRSLTLPRAA